jgi:hypothetical protein
VDHGDQKVTDERRRGLFHGARRPDPTSPNLILTAGKETDIVLSDRPVSAKPSRRRVASWKRASPLLAVLALNSCIVYFSTAPTPGSGATIVFVATDGRGASVRSLHVTIVDVAGAWRADGVTGGDGSFRCGVDPGVRRVRAEVVPPAGYVLARSDNWPRDIDVSGGDDMRVEVHVTSR